MASSIIAKYREHLASQGKDSTQATDKDLALELYSALTEQKKDFEKFAENRNDPEFAQLVRDAYEENKTFKGSAIDSIPAEYYNRKTGLQQGASVVAGAVGMEDTAKDLMRDAKRNERKANKYQKNIFNDIQMIDDPIDGLKYVTQAITSTAVSVVPDMALSLLTRGAGGKIQKSLEKGGKLKDVRKKLEKTMGEDYGKNIGTVAGAFGTSAVENTGHVYGDLYEYTKLDPSDEKYLSPSEARALSMVGGGASATLDSVLPVWLVGKLSKSIGADAAQKEVTKMFNSMPEGMVLLAKGTAGEGVTEGLQEVVQMLTVKYHTDEEWSPQDWNRLINASVMGAIGGGTVTGGTAAVGRMLEAPETRPWDPKLEEVDTKKEREEIRNRNALRRYADLEVGTIVSPAGSDKLARVVSKNEEDTTVVVEFRDGLTQRMDPTKLNIKQDKKKIIKEEDLENFSDQKLEELKVYSPNLTTAIEKEQNRRKVEVEEEDKLKRLDTAIEVSEKGNQIIAIDSSSKERIYSATFSEEEGLLVLSNEANDSLNDQRSDQARGLIHKQLKAKAKKLGMPYKIGEVVEYPLTSSEIDQIDSKAQLLTEYAKLRSRYNLLGMREPETEDRLIARMQELGMISLDRNNRPILGQVNLRKGSNSRLLTANPEVGSVLSGSIFTDLESNLLSYEETLNASQINEKFILKEAKAIVGDMAETIEGLNHSDVARIAEGATELFKKHYLDEDGGWKAGKTTKDIEDEEAERKEIALMRKQESKDRFDLIKPQVGNFIQVAKGQALQKITSVDEENFTVRTTEGGDNDISARSIIKQSEERPLERKGEFVTELANGKVRKKVVVTGSDTNGEYRGRKSLTVTFEKNGDVISVTDSENNYYSDVKGISVDDEGFQSQLASITLTKVVKPESPAPKPVKIAENIFRVGNTIEGSVFQAKGTTKIGKHELSPILSDNTGRVAGIKVGDEEFSFDEPVPASDWVDTARTKLKAEGLYGKKSATPKRIFREPKNEIVFRSRDGAILTPPISMKEVEVNKEDPSLSFDELLSDVDRSKLSESKSTKSLVALKYYYPGAEQPAILIRRLASSKGFVVIRDMKRKGAKTIDPLGETSRFSISLDSDEYYAALDGDERIEPLALLSIPEEVDVTSEFKSEEEFRSVLDPYLDQSKVRVDPIGILDSIDKEIEGTSDPEVEDKLRRQRDRIETMVQDEDGQFNPLLDIFGYVGDKTITKLKDEIKKIIPAIKDKEIKAKGRKIINSSNLRILDITEFLGGISTKKGSWKLGIKALGNDGEEFQSLDKVITSALNEFSQKGYTPRATKGTGTDAMSRAVNSSLEESRVASVEASGIEGLSGGDFDENDFEASQTNVQDFGATTEAELVEDDQGLSSVIDDFDDDQPSLISEVAEPINETYVEMAQAAMANPSISPEDLSDIEVALDKYKNSKPTERDSRASILIEALVKSQRDPESVGEVAVTSDILEREISDIDKSFRLTPAFNEMAEGTSQEWTEGFMSEIPFVDEDVHKFINKSYATMDSLRSLPVFKKLSPSSLKSLLKLTRDSSRLDKLMGGKKNKLPVTETLDRILRDNPGNEYAGVISVLLKKHRDLLNKVYVFSYKGGNEYAGFNFKNFIGLNSESPNNLVATIVHEAVHAITVNQIESRDPGKLLSFITTDWQDTIGGIQSGNGPKVLRDPLELFDQMKGFALDAIAEDPSSPEARILDGYMTYVEAMGKTYSVGRAFKDKYPDVEGLMQGKNLAEIHEYMIQADPDLYYSSLNDANTNAANSINAINSAYGLKNINEFIAALFDKTKGINEDLAGFAGFTSGEGGASLISMQLRDLGQSWSTDETGTQPDSILSTRSIKGNRDSLLDVIIQALKDLLNRSLGRNNLLVDLVEEALSVGDRELNRRSSFSRAIPSRVMRGQELPPLPEQLIEENSVALQRFLGGAVIDGEPIRLEAYVNRMLNTIVGVSSVDSDILDMAQQLMSHPYAKDLEVKFESWENFKLGASSDGRNGKITRAYLRGNTIVMGPVYKLKLDSDLSVDDHIRVTLLEEIAHSVLDKAVDVAVQTNRKGELPANVRGVISKEKADKLYRETAEIMDWLRTQTDGEYYQGLLNKREFWANFATNPRFRSFLNRPMPPELRRRFQSRFERVIDWMLDLASKIFDADFTRQASTLDVIRKRYRTVLRTADKLAANDLSIESKQSESRGNVLDPSPKLVYGRGNAEAKTKSAIETSSQLGIAIEELRDALDGGTPGASVDTLKNWAVSNGAILNKRLFQAKLSGLQKLESGSEHAPYYDKASNRVIKVTNSILPFGQQDNALDYFVDKHNSNFILEDDVRFEGIIETFDGISVVISQPFIKGKKLPSEAGNTEESRTAWIESQMEAELNDRGFYRNDSGVFELKYGDGTWAGVTIEDTHPKNVVWDGDSIKFIDVHVVVPDGDFIEDYFEDDAEPVESADTFDSADPSVAQGTIRAHMTALMDLGNVISSALTEVGEDSSISVEKMKEYQVVKDGSTPEVIAKVLADKAASVDEVIAQYRQALPEEVRPTEGLNNINELESIANRDTAARNLLKLLTGTRESASDLLSSSLKNYEKLKSKLENASDAIARLTSTKTMFDASKTQRQLAKAMRNAIYKQSESGEGSKVNSFEAALIAEGKEINLTDFKKLRNAEIDEGKLFSLLEVLSEGYEGVRFIEQLTAEEIFDSLSNLSNAHSLVTNADPDPDLDQAVKIGIALMLGKDQKNSIPRSAFTTRLRLAKGQVSHEIADAVRLIKDAANGRPVRDIKDRSMRSIIDNVKNIKADIDEYKADLEKVKEEIRVGEIHLKVYDERIADLDEYFETAAPVELREGGEYSMLEIDADGKIQETSFVFRLGNGESSEEAKYSAAKASELNKIMQTEQYIRKYKGSPLDRYFKQLVIELRKPNFGIQYHTAHVGFLHAMAQSLQERLSNLGSVGKMTASLLNSYNRDYNAEVGAISSQGKKVSKAIRRLHREMARESGENLNQFIKGFGSKLFDWFNERPDLQGQEEQAINRVWSDLKKSDPTRQYTEEGKRALRAYLKQWGIQNDNFRRLYKKYDIKVEDENVPRGEIALGVNSSNLFRDFVEQGVFTTPRKLNRSKIHRVVSLLDTKFAEKDYVDEESDGNLFGKVLASMQEAKASGVDMEESFQQILGKSVVPELSNLFFSPIFNGKSAHNVPFVLQSIDAEGRKSKRVLLPEELQRAWRNAEGNNEGIRVANAIISLAKIMPDYNEDTLFNLVGQMKHRASALIKVERESRQEDTAIDNNPDLMRMLKGSDFHHSIHGRSLYNILPGEFFEYEMYDETSSSQHLSKIMMTAHFGRKGEKLADNFKAIKEQYVSAKDEYADYAEAAGVSLRGGRPPSRNIFGYAIKVRKIKAEMANRGKDPQKYQELETKAKAFYEAENAIAATSAAFTSRSSNNADLSMGLDALRALAFGLVNTMKGAWTSVMSMPDIVKKMGLNPTAFRTLGGAMKNLPQEIAGSFLESFGIEMVRPHKYNEELRDMYGREQGMLGFDEFTTEIGKEGSLSVGQATFRKIVNIVQGLSQAGGSMRSKTSVNFIPGSVLTPATAPFSYLAQAVNKSISLSMADTIERFVLRAVDAMETKGITNDNNTFEVSAKDLGYEDSKLDSWIFGSVDMVDKLNQRLTAEGMSFAQLAQDYRRRRELDPDAKVLSIDAVRAAQNIAMSEVTYDTMAGKPSAALSGVGQFFSPLLSWSASSYNKGLDQMRNKEGRLAMKESVRYMLTASAWLMPVGIAFTMFMDWWDEEVLGKPSSLRKVPPIAMLPGIGTFMAMTDPRFDTAAMLERAARANNIFGLGQEFLTPLFVGQLDPSSLGAKFDPTRRVLAISTVMNAYAVAMNYGNAIRTSKGKAEDFVPDYATVVRPLMYLMGLNAVIQNTQAATNLTGLEELDPTGFMTNERQVADITGMRNSFRVFAKALGMEMRRGGIMQFSTTALGNALKRMERAAYANDRQAFKDAYRKAIELSQADDRRKDVADRFRSRHIRNGVTRYSMTDADIRAILSVMDPDERIKILNAMRNHDFYLKAIGGTPSKPKKDIGQYKESLRRLAL